MTKCPVPLGSLAARLRDIGHPASETDQVAQDLWLENCEKGTEFGNCRATMASLTGQCRYFGVGRTSCRAAKWIASTSAWTKTMEASRS